MIYLLSAILALILILIVWLWLIAPRRTMKARLLSLAKYDYAHRGLHNNDKGVPENSLKAFRIAAEAGFGIELDLQLTKDKRVVVHHDADLKRSCGADVRIADLTFDELSAYSLFGTEEKIPTFEDAMLAIGRRVPVIVEIKNYQSSGRICPLVLPILEDYSGEYTIESFDPFIVRWFKEHAAQILRGQLMDRLEKGKNGLNFFTAFMARNMLTNFLARPDYEAYNFEFRQNPSLRLSRRALGMQEVSWTLKNPADYQAAKADGCICIFEGFEPNKAPEEVKFSTPVAEKPAAVVQMKREKP